VASAVCWWRRGL